MILRCLLWFAWAAVGMSAESVWPTYSWDWSLSLEQNQNQLVQFVEAQTAEDQLVVVERGKANPYGPDKSNDAYVDTAPKQFIHDVKFPEGFGGSENIPSNHSSSIRATFLVLCRNNELFELLKTIRSLTDHFPYHYDFTFLNDKHFSPEFISVVSAFVQEGTLNFGSIPKEHWSYPPHIDQQRAAAVREEYTGKFPYGGSESYRHMCRFYAGFFYKHPLVKQYQYYWRIEPGVHYYCDITYDVFEYMAIHGKKYSFTISMFEYSDTIPTLWDTYKGFKQQHNVTGPLESLVTNDNTEQTYNLCHFWSNFEIADLSMYDETYDQFFAYLDASGGFYYERWGDAPVHTLAVSLFLSPEEVHWFGDFGYHHEPYTQCPPLCGLFLERRCSCDPSEDFTASFLSCTPFLVSKLDQMSKKGSQS